MKSKIIALIVALAMALPLLAACGGDGGKETERQTKGATETRGQEDTGDWWEDVDFGGEELIVNVSVAINPEQTFGAADVYSRGPDSLEGVNDTVQKMVFNRNKNVEDALGLSVTWQETDKPVGSSQEVIENFVRMNPDNSPDIFINDVYDLIHAMLTGSLWNLLDAKDGTGAPLECYFDFTNEAWYWDYMRGTTITSDKIYMVSGDYFFDMIRYAYVIYVNRTMFDSIMADQCITVHQLYEDVLDGYWDYDTMEMYMEIVPYDSNNDGVTTKDDETISFAVSPHLERTFTLTSGISMLKWEDNELYNGKPYVPTENADMAEYIGKFSELFNTPGLLYMEGAEGVRNCVVLFIENRALFSLSMMGELESEEVRNSSVNKGVLPIPMYDAGKQESYHTLVHDQAEIGCILNNTDHFTEASAYLQLVNEQSVDVLTQYYDKTLMLRYNDDPDTKAMIDLIHKEIGTPFDMILARLVISGGTYLPNAAYTGAEIFNIVLADAKERKTTFSSTYSSSYDGWCQNLEVLKELFENME